MDYFLDIYYMLMLLLCTRRMICCLYLFFFLFSSSYFVCCCLLLFIMLYQLKLCWRRRSFLPPYYQIVVVRVKRGRVHASIVDTSVASSSFDSAVLPQTKRKIHLRCVNNKSNEVFRRRPNALLIDWVHFL